MLRANDAQTYGYRRTLKVLDDKNAVMYTGEASILPASPL
jgi:hypothetical protein